MESEQPTISAHYSCQGAQFLSQSRPWTRINGHLCLVRSHFLQWKWSVEAVRKCVAGVISCPLCPHFVPAWSSARRQLLAARSLCPWTRLVPPTVVSACTSGGGKERSAFGHRIGHDNALYTLSSIFQWKIVHPQSHYFILLFGELDMRCGH